MDALRNVTAHAGSNSKATARPQKVREFAALYGDVTAVELVFTTDGASMTQQIVQAREKALRKIAARRSRNDSS
jgi:hypothetical protein